MDSKGAKDYHDQSERLENLILRTPIIDTHNDFPYLLRVQLHNEFESNKNFKFDGKLESHTDLPNLLKGRVGVQFFSCFIECKDEDYKYQDFNKPNSAVRDTIEQIDVVKRLANVYSEHMKYVRNSEEALEAYYSGKIAISMGVEGLHQVDTSLGVLRRFHELGVRYVTLTHNCDNPFATAASSVKAGLPDKGLTPYGVECIKEMNRLGLIVDLSHVSHKTMLDALETTKAPVMFSHSSAFSVTPNVRNVPDDVLLKVKENGGVVCVNFYPAFISTNKDKTATIQDAVKHILYIANLIGWEHVGLGSDFDGIPEGPKGLENVGKYPDLIKMVMSVSGATNEEISMLMGENVMRVWKQNEMIASLLQKQEEPVVELNWENRVWKFFTYAKDFPEIYPGSYIEKKNIYVDAQRLDLSLK